MKKAIPLLLALVMCLPLCACGSSDEAPVMETKSVEETAAPAETGIAGNATVPQIEETTQMPTEETESAFANHPLLPQIYGTWEFEKWGDHNNEYQLYKSLTINEDGSCIVDGTSANWEISETQTNDTFLVILVCIDSEYIYGAQFGEGTDVDGNANIFLHAFEGEYGAILPTTFIQKS